jgi:hypothetical protein
MNLSTSGWVILTRKLVAGFHPQNDNRVASGHPEWLYARTKAQNPESVVGEFFVEVSARTVYLRHESIPSNLATWNADSNSTARCLFLDGTIVVTQDNGQVCILKLHHGNRRVSLAEAGVLLASQQQKAG